MQVSHNQEQLIFEKFNKRTIADKISQAEFIEEITPRSSFLQSGADALHR